MLILCQEVRIFVSEYPVDFVSDLSVNDDDDLLHLL